ncbi:MAG: hypothetical protein Q9190_005373 [Brigantiaea leucoxantha]
MASDFHVPLAPCHLREMGSGFSSPDGNCWIVPSLPPAIVVSDPKNVEHVLRNNDLFIKGAFFRSRSWDLFGNGIINADGELWKIQRKAGLRFFSIGILKTFINDALPPILADTEKRLDAVAKQGGITDMQDVFLELTTRLMGKMAYDMDMPASLPFSKAFDYASGAIGDRFQNPFWKIKEFVLGAPLRRAVSEIKRFSSIIVSSTVEARYNDGLSSNVHKAERGKPLQNNLINSLLDHISEHQVVADAAMNYLSAGRDTTAQSLTWTLYLLLRHPNIQEPLLDELYDLFPSKATSAPLNLDLDTVQPSHLPYTYSIFTESLRLYPPVPFELKECVAPTTFPDGTWLPKGAVVLWVPWAMGRSYDIWGADAEIFKPERWLSTDRKTIQLQKSPYEFPVFNAGPRSCLGKKLAELLAVDVLARMMWRYDFEEVIDVKEGGCGIGNERRSQNSLTLPMEGGLPVRIKIREKGRK